MTKQKTTTNFKRLLKTVGPGLLFASSSIGTSHLVLSTRAGAHHGMIYFWIILAALLLKYPFFEFGPRYANATGHSLLKGYKDQGTWAVVLFTMIIFVSMFAVVAGVGAVSAGLLSTMYGMGDIPMNYMFGGLLLVTGSLLLIGRYSALDNFIKIISILLFVTVVTAFFAVLFKEPIIPIDNFEPNHKILEGTGLILLIGLIGWMPTGLEASTMNSIWVVEKVKSLGYRPTLKETLFDFNLGYLLTVILAFMFLVIGAFTVYGSGVLLDDQSSTAFSNKLLSIFTTHLGDWAYPVMAMAAFITIYGTLITAWDAFTRGFVRGLRIFIYGNIDDSKEQQHFLKRYYNVFLVTIGIGAYFLFTQYTGGMVKLLELATAISFLVGPVIAFLNLRAIQSPEVPVSHRPSKGMLLLSHIGLIAMTLFAFYYLYNVWQNGMGH